MCVCVGVCRCGWVMCDVGVCGVMWGCVGVWCDIWVCVWVCVCVCVMWGCVV